MYSLGYCYEHGLGKEKNVSKAREIYLNAMNKSSKAWVPVLIALGKMEFMNAYQLSTVSLNDIEYFAAIENIGLVVCAVLLIILLLVKVYNQNHTVHPVPH